MAFDSAHDPTTEALIEQAAIDAYCLLSAMESSHGQKAVTRTIRAGDDVFSLRLAINDHFGSIQGQADGWRAVYERLKALGMDISGEGNGIQKALSFLDDLAERAGI